jgi:hypothetical protein
LRTERLRRQWPLPPTIRIGLLVAIVFAGGVGVVTLVAGVDATPRWMRLLAVGIAQLLGCLYMGNALARAVARLCMKRASKHIAARRFRDAAPTLDLCVMLLEQVCGSYHPVTLRWTYTRAHVLLHNGQRVRAIAMLALVIDSQMTMLGTDHPDTRRSMRLLERHTEDLTAPIEPIETWWQASSR